MRGAVSLAAALAIPLATDSGAAFPGRDLILFVTFSVILFTLVVQGSSLPVLIRALGVQESGDEERSEELRGRPAIADPALGRIEALSAADWTNEGSIERMRALYQRLMHQDFDVQRDALVELRGGGVSSEMVRRLERELDLEESRLEV